MVAFERKSRVLSRETKRNAIESVFLGFYEKKEKGGKETGKEKGLNVCTGVYV